MNSDFKNLELLILGITINEIKTLTNAFEIRNQATY